MAMERLQQQVTAVTDELNLIRAEIVQLKTSHANMHQSDVETRAQYGKAFDDAANRMLSVEQQLNIIQRDASGTGSFGKTKKPLIEPKNIEVPVFQGSMVDSRAKFLSWGERVKDRTGLYDQQLHDALTKAEFADEPITKTKSMEMGVDEVASREFHSFLKDKTDGTANAIVRNNKEGVGLESWRLLCRQFNMKTLQNELTAQELETHPRGGI